MRANPNRGLKSATLNALDPDPETDSLKESLRAVHLQRDDFQLPWAIYMQAKTGHETPGNVKRLRNDQRTKEIRKARKELRLESINTNQVARISKATVRSELSSMRWHTEVPAGRKKAREMPHTLHERRPWKDKENQQKNCIDYVPPTEPLQLGKDNWGQAKHKAEQLVKNAMVSEVIKKDWVKLIQAEDILASDAKAFIPRVQEEETL